MTDEERKAIENMKSLLLYSKEHEYFSPFQEQEIDDMDVVLNIVEKQSKKIEELNDKLTEKICKGVEEEILEEYRQTIISKDKEIEELKEKNRQGKMRIVQLENEITARIEDVNQYYTPNDKIKAIIEELAKQDRESIMAHNYLVIPVLESLLEKE